MRDLTADGYVAGMHDAAQALKAAGVDVTVATNELSTLIDWDNWSPGNPGLADKIAENGGAWWAQLLDQADATVSGLADTQMQHLAYAIAEAVDSGASADELASNLSDLLDGNDARAEVIARTETNRVMSGGSMDAYADNGVVGWDLILSDGACPECEDVADANPHDMDDTADVPPVHVCCRCSVSPVLPDGSEGDEDGGE